MGPYLNMKVLAVDSGFSGSAQTNLDVALGSLIEQSRQEWASDNEIAVWINDGSGQKNVTHSDWTAIETMSLFGIREHYTVYLSRIMHGDGKLYLDKGDILVRK